MIKITKVVTLDVLSSIEVSEKEYTEFMRLRKSPFPEDRVKYQELFEKYEQATALQADEFLTEHCVGKVKLDTIGWEYGDGELMVEDKNGHKTEIFWND